MLDALRLHIRHMAKWHNTAVKILGVVESVMALMLLVPAFVALIYGEDPFIFLLLVPFLLGMGLFQYLFFASDKKMSPAVGLLMMTVAWAIAFFTVMVPYYVYGFNWYDAVFEAVSGFTTTGASIVPDVEVLPKSILFWRSFSQWMGGIAVVLVFMFLLPMMGIGGRMFINNELAGTDIANFSYKLKSIAKSFIIIYMMFTGLEIILLFAVGVNPYEAICMTLSNISTGGLMVKGDSIASYSFAVQAIVLVFMFLGGTNFFLHYRMIYKRDYSAYLKSQEFIWTFMWFAVATVLIVAAVTFTAGTYGLGEVGNTVWEALFTVVSIGTSTGYFICDFTAWPVVAAMILLAVGFLGAMSGSTAGGVKIYRLLILKSYVSYGFYKMLHPHAVRDVRLDGNMIGTDTLMSTVVITLSFIGVATVGVVYLLISEPGISLLDAAGLCVCSISNVGQAAGQFGPYASMADLSVMTKLGMSALMWIGRLEVFMVLLLFTRAFWKDVILNTNKVPSPMRERRSIKEYAMLRKRR
ncbi:MAG: TrkH family potassium uptake protein [Candidatus Methanomethylophilaceae archaeon]